MNGGAVPFHDVWNAIKDLAHLMQDGASIHMSNTAFAVPSGHQPGELDWAEEAEHQIDGVIDASSRAYSSGWPFANPTILHIGCTWRFGGRLQGHGRFLHEARLYATLQACGHGVTFDATGSFGDPYLRGQTGVLAGVIDVTCREYGQHAFQHRYDVEIAGDGAGTLRQTA